jgi:VIT1/CCC1 family predicted Fe2+/Mn2+ transporter
MSTASSAVHQSEAHLTNLGGRLNWLRAGVLGANDGIVSVAGILAGVAGATNDLSTILTAGVAGAVAGSFSMAGGEYVSVNTQRDTEEAALRRERWELEHLPEQEEAELAGLYRGQGLSTELSHQVARELTADNPLDAHARLELGIDPNGLTSPWAAAGSSFIAFAIGSLLPIAAIALPPRDWRIAVCYVGTVIGLILTGGISAHLGDAHRMPAILRNVGVGTLTMVFTYFVGTLFDTTVS